MSQQHMQILLLAKGWRGSRNTAVASKCLGQWRRLGRAQERSENDLAGQGVPELFRFHFKQVIQNLL